MLVPEVAKLLGLAVQPTPELVEILAGNRVIAGMAPYAACYGGHQFGAWAGQLGDGRAITLAEVVGVDTEGATATWEIQLKGAGPTPYSRRADGRAVLRSSIRELVCSEAMLAGGRSSTVSRPVNAGTPGASTASPPNSAADNGDVQCFSSGPSPIAGTTPGPSGHRPTSST